MNKRTAAITLAILGALSVTACSEQKIDPTTYSSLAECTADGNSTTLCEQARDEAKKLTEANAPKFSSADQCAAQFSNCEKSSSGDWFMPAVMGYMVGSMMNNGSRAPATPVYYDRDRRPQAASYVGGVYRPTPAAPSYNARQASRGSYSAGGRASTSSRGGFGGRASSASS